MTRSTHPKAIALAMLCLIEGAAEASASDPGQAAIDRALEVCRPTEEEIRQNEADRMKAPVHMRELTHVDYRVNSCDQAARLCRASPRATGCRKFLAEMERRSEDG